MVVRIEPTSFGLSPNPSIKTLETLVKMCGDTYSSKSEASRASERQSAAELELAGGIA
jgi:hypothetical protein